MMLPSSELGRMHIIYLSIVFNTLCEIHMQFALCIISVKTVCSGKPNKNFNKINLPHCCLIRFVVNLPAGAAFCFSDLIYFISF